MIHPHKILMHRDVSFKIRDDARTYASRGLESGGYLVGKIHQPSMAYEITDFIDGGPNASRGPASFSGDNAHAQQKKLELQQQNPEKRLLGEYHLHPWDSPPHPSGGDLHQLQQVKHGKRPWYMIMLASRQVFRFWDLDKKGESLETVPCQVLPSMSTDLDAERLLDRVSEITQKETLADKTALIVGLGSGGSVIAKYLANTGIGTMVLADNESLELVNVIRHEGTISDIGKAKVDICKKVTESHNPFVRVDTHQFDASSDVEKLDVLISESDLVVASTGNAKINGIINKISLERNTPAVYGGIYERARGGYILPVLPNETACFNCLFNLTAEAYHVDKAAAQAYNISENELHAQQGLWMDISIPALMQSKVALMILQEQTAFLESFNLLLYRNPFEIQRMKVQRRHDCAACNLEGWFEEQERRCVDEEAAPRVEQSFFARLKGQFGRRNDTDLDGASDP